MQQAEAGSTGAASAETTPAANPTAPAAEVVVETNATEPSAADVELFAAEGDDVAVVTAPAPAAVPVVDPAAPAAPAVAPVAIPAVATPAPAAAPAAQPAASPAAVVPAVAEPAKPVVEVAETPEAKTARETAEKVADEKLFNGLVDYYKIPDDMAARLPTEPEMVLPVLAARVHQAVVRSVATMMSQQLPQHIGQVIHLQKVDREAKEAFYKAWPGLTAYEEQVLQAGAMYRKLNPTASPDVAIKAIGKIVSDSLGFTVASAPAASAAAAVAAAPAVFAPAGSSGARSAAPATTENEFERMAAETD